MTDKPVRSHDAALARVMADAKRQAAERPRPLSSIEIEAERARCRRDAVYFINNYCQILDNVAQAWIPFKLWPEQERVILIVLGNKYSVFLKARQMGISWCIVVAIPLWKMLFHPIAKVLMFSQRDDEAAAMLKRLKEMHEHLPDWMQQIVTKSNDHELGFGNESNATALTATAGGRSIAATYVAIDEADFIEDTASLVKAAKPTIDAGQGQMVMLSTVNDETPGSYFQRFVKTALKGETDWKALFLSWRAAPWRTQAWYDKTAKDTLLLEGSLDSVYKEYPETEEQALAARSSNKRFPPFWISYFSHELRGLHFTSSAPVLPGLIIYREPEAGHSFGLGVDPAEGMQSSDDSVITVIDEDTREEVAVLAGKIEPTMLADYAAALSVYYFNAPVLPERNNHGGLFIAAIRKEHSATPIRNYIIDGKPGWHTSHTSKVKLYTHAVELMQGFIKQVGDFEIGQLDPDKLPKIIHNPKTIEQLSSIEAGTNEKAPAAPEGFHDDYAMAWVLAQMCVMVATSSMQQVPYTGLWKHRDETAEPRTFASRTAAPLAPLSSSPSEISDYRNRLRIRR